MSSELIESINPFQPAPKVADRATIRKFVKDLNEMAEKIKDAKENLREAIISCDEIESIDDQIKKLKEERKEIIANNAVIQGYVGELNDVLEEKNQLIGDAKQDGVPKNEIETAIKMLRKDIDPKLSLEIYSDIADLVD